MWIDTRECVPLTDGEYLVQTVYGKVSPMLYTYEGGWNTFVDNKGELNNTNAFDNLYVVRWFTAIKPDDVPKEWYEEYCKSEVIK